jgi:hypothetical protein
MTAIATLLVAALAGQSEPAPPPQPAWSTTVGLGLISITGNARSTTATLTAATERKSAAWIFGAKAFATYGRSRPVGAEEDEQVAEAAGLTLRVDRSFGKRYSAYAIGALDGDHVKSIELRSAGELGAAAIWIDSGTDEGWRTLFRTDLGFRIAEERRWQYYPTAADLEDETLYAPRLGLALKFARGKAVVFTEDAEVLPNVVGDSRVLVNSVTKLTSRLADALALAVAYTVAFDSRPAPGKVETDTTLAVTLETTF